MLLEQLRHWSRPQLDCTPAQRPQISSLHSGTFFPSYIELNACAHCKWSVFFCDEANNRRQGDPSRLWRYFSCTFTASSVVKAEIPLLAPNNIILPKELPQWTDNNLSLRFMLR